MKWVEMTKEVESKEVEREKPTVSDNREGIQIMDVHNIIVYIQHLCDEVLFYI